MSTDNGHYRQQVHENAQMTTPVAPPSGAHTDACGEADVRCEIAQFGHSRDPSNSPLVEPMPGQCTPTQPIETANKTMHARSNTTRLTVVYNARIWTTDEHSSVYDNGTIAFDTASIVYVGESNRYDATAIERARDVTRVDARGSVVSAALIDMHSHAGVFSWPALGTVTSDGNELTEPALPQLRVVDAFDTSDRAIALIRDHGGVVTTQILPGSGNVMGGQGALVKLRPHAVRIADMLVDGAPMTLKMACGENPKRVYGARGRMPSTRMGVAWVLRERFTAARDLRRRQQRWCTRALARHESVFDPLFDGYMPEDASLQPLVGLLERGADRNRTRIILNVHCYLPVDMDAMLRVADEFDFTVDTFHHALGAHEVADELARRHIGIATFADLWGYKREAYVDSTLQSISKLRRAGVRVALKSDHPVMPSFRLIDEVAKAMNYGQFDDEQQALASVTRVPAQLLGLERRVGSLEVGKDADIVLWRGHPLRYGATPQRVWVDGVPSSTIDVTADESVSDDRALDSFNSSSSSSQVDRVFARYRRHESQPYTECSGDVFDTGSYILRGFDIIDTASVETAQRHGKGVRYAECEAGVVDGVLECLHCASIDDNVQYPTKFTNRCFFSHPDYSQAIEFDFASRDSNESTATDDNSRRRRRRPVAVEGFIAANNHLGQLDIEAEDETRDGTIESPNAGAGTDGEHYRLALDEERARSSVKASYGLHLMNRHTHVAIDAGITTSIAAPRSPGVVHGQSVAFLVGERTSSYSFLKDPASLHITIGNEAKSSSTTASYSAQLSLLDQLLSEADERQRRNASADDEQRQALTPLDRVVRGELTLSVHVNRAEDIEALVRMKRKYTFDLLVIGAADAALVAEQLSAANARVILSPLRCVPDRWETRRCNWRANVRALRDANVHFGIAIDDPGSLRQLRWEARTLVDEGFSVETALATITQHVASAYRLPSSAGALTRNGRANFALFDDSNPLSIHSRLLVASSGRTLHCAPRLE